jgi:hypothetical protein
VRCQGHIQVDNFRPLSLLRWAWGDQLRVSQIDTRTLLALVPLKGQVYVAPHEEGLGGWWGWKASCFLKVNVSVGSARVGGVGDYRGSVCSKSAHWNN